MCVYYMYIHDNVMYIHNIMLNMEEGAIILCIRKVWCIILCTIASQLATCILYALHSIVQIASMSYNII